MEELSKLCQLYSRTKLIVLQAEQADPDTKSNIAVFKEQRDALDHLMRAIGEHIDKGVESNKAYIADHFSKAHGHLYRAAFDSLDGIGVAAKVKLERAVEGFSNEALIAVYSEYFDHVVEMDKLDEQITAHRASKDVSRSTLQVLDEYSTSVARMAEISRGAVARVPAFQEWERRNAKKKLWERIEKIVIPLIVSLVTFGACQFYYAVAKQKPTLENPPQAADFSKNEAVTGEKNRRN